MNRSLTEMLFVETILSLMISAVFLVTSVQAEEVKWQLVGRTADKNWLLHYDPKGVEYSSDGLVRVKVRLELSNEGEAKYRKNFDASVKKAEEEAGQKIEDVDILFKAIVKSESRQYIYEIDCKEKQFKRQRLPMGFINIVEVFPIQPDSSEESLLNMLCKR